jgi:cytochrome c
LRFCYVKPWLIRSLPGSATNKMGVGPMGGLFWNKVFGALLATALVIFGIRELSHALVHPHVPEHPGYAIAVENTGGDDAAPVEVVKEVSLAELLSTSSASSGERVAKKCAACHTFDKGGANKTGPNLHNLVGRSAASLAGFKYSSAMTGSGLSWDFETLNTFLTKPKELVPGTAMSFAGLKKAKDRANLIAWINTQSDAPVAFPAFPAFADPLQAAATEASEAVGMGETMVQGAADMVEQAASGASETAQDVLDALPGGAELVTEVNETIEETTGVSLPEIPAVPDVPAEDD